MNKKITSTKKKSPVKKTNITKQRLSHTPTTNLTHSWKLFGVAVWIVLSILVLAHIAYRKGLKSENSDHPAYCLGKIKECGTDALGFQYEGHLYCYNTHDEFVKRCREAIPYQNSCHNGHCFYAGNYQNEDFSGNCHWGYFDFDDAQDWCIKKGGTTVSKEEMQKLWDTFMKCQPSFGKHSESCYWTNTTACKTKDGWNNARRDGYINAGGGFCRIK